MTKTLTEQWREGTLPCGAYYVNRLDEIRIYFVTYEDNKYTHEIYEIIAPVPRYKEYKHLQEQIKKLKYYRDRSHKALCEISVLSEKEMDSGKAWDIAHDAILCLNEISGV